MGRTVISEASVRTRLISFGTLGYEVGLILGQNSEKEDYLVHLARTPPPRSRNVIEETSISSSSNTDEDSHKKCFKSIQDIPESWLADHANDVIRILPGGMCVVGIFIAGPDDTLDNSINVQKFKSILAAIQRNLSSNKYIYGNNHQYFILNYNSKTQRCICKMLDDIKNGILKPVDIKFRAQGIPWLELETAVNLDRMFCIGVEKEPESLKEQLQEILEDVSNTIDFALVVIGGKIRSPDDTIETMIMYEDNKKQLEVDLYIPCVSNLLKSPSTDVKIKPSSESMWLVGQLVSKTFVTGKTSIEEATRAIKQDIVRSLASRLEMHWDSLIEEETGSPEENITLHEPPRRILIYLHKSRVTLSSYLFPGEEPQEALISLQELLDVDAEDLDIQKEIEHHAESIDTYQCSTPTIPVNTEKAESCLTSTHIAGLGVTIFIIIAAIIFQHMY